MLRVSEKDIQSVIQIIAREADPKYILLFGSRSKGEAKPYSDLDLLVVERFSSSTVNGRMQKLVRLERALEDMLVPTDILLYSEEEVDTWKDSPNHIIGRAVREGKIVYERT